MFFTHNLKLNFRKKQGKYVAGSIDFMPLYCLNLYSVIM